MRRVETTLFDLVRAISERTRDDQKTAWILARLLREERIFDSRGAVLRLALPPEAQTARGASSPARPGSGGRLASFVRCGVREGGHAPVDHQEVTR